MATLLVSLALALVFFQVTPADHSETRAILQIFKIVAPFVFPLGRVATLNARLGMPPFALFLVALSLTDGARSPLTRH